MTPVFKIVPRAEWAEATDAYEGSAHDRADGFLHLTVQLGELAHRPGNKCRVEDKAGKVPKRDFSLLQQTRTGPEHQDDGAEQGEKNK